MLDMATLKISDAPPQAGAMLDAQGRSTLGGPRRTAGDSFVGDVAQAMADHFKDDPLVEGISLNGTPVLPQDRAPNDVGGVSGQRLKQFIERVERVTAEQKALGDDKKQIFAEAKSTGFCTKTMRKIIRLRGMDAEKRREEEQMQELYMSAIGMQTEMDV